MKSLRTTITLAAAAALLTLIAAGCRISYKLNGAALDYNIYKTVHIDNFPIRAALVYPPLQQMFENELLDYRGSIPLSTTKKSFKVFLRLFLLFTIKLETWIVSRNGLIEQKLFLVNKQWRDYIIAK